MVVVEEWLLHLWITISTICQFPHTSHDFQSSNGVPPNCHPLADYIWDRLLDSYTFSNVKNFVT